MVSRGLAVIATMVSVTASAQPRPAPPALVGASLAFEVANPEGFVDDAIWSDGTRLAYVETDGSTKATLHVVTLATKADAATDITSITTHPLAVRLVGTRAFVVGQAEDGTETGALFELTPKHAVIYKLGPATHVTLFEQGAKTRVAVYRASPQDNGTRHEVAVYAIENGARLAIGHLDLDAQNANASLDFHVNHWADGMSRAFGIKGGAWDPKENMRTPNVEATYDVALGKFVELTPISDLFEQRKRYQVLAAAGGRLDFAKLTWDNQAVQLWRAGKPTALSLDQPLQQYDPKSLQGDFAPDGTAWIALQVDPVNPDAVARRKADPEYFDVFRVDGTKATRVARVLAAGIHFRLGAASATRFWLLQRSTGFDRGGKTLTVGDFSP